MKLAMPQEIEVWYILPAIRKELVKTLIQDHKLSQKEAAAALGLTEPAVSQYLKEKRGKDVKFGKSVRDEIKKSAEVIMKKKEAVIPEMVRISRLLDVRKVICDIHRRGSKGLENCSACFEEELLVIQ